MVLHNRTTRSSFGVLRRSIIIFIITASIVFKAIYQPIVQHIFNVVSNISESGQPQVHTFFSNLPAFRISKNGLNGVLGNCFVSVESTVSESCLLPSPRRAFLALAELSDAFCRMLYGGRLGLATGIRKRGIINAIGDEMKRHHQRKQAVCRNAGLKTRRRFSRNSSVESLLSPRHLSFSRGFGGAVLRIIDSKKSLQSFNQVNGLNLYGCISIVSFKYSFPVAVFLERVVSVILAAWIDRLFAPVMALSSAGLARNGEPKVLSYAQAVAKSADNPSFVMPMRFPVDINGELGFIFSEPEMTKAAEDYKFAIVLKFL
ncbi:hypothetical protein ACLOJK_009124 [Asimina triloba]